MTSGVGGGRGAGQLLGVRRGLWNMIQACLWGSGRMRTEVGAGVVVRGGLEGRVGGGRGRG